MTASAASTSAPLFPQPDGAAGLDDASLCELTERYCRRVLMTLLSQPDEHILVTGMEKSPRLHPAARLVLSVMLKGARVWQKNLCSPVTAPSSSASAPLPPAGLESDLLLAPQSALGEAALSHLLPAELETMVHELLAEQNESALFLPGGRPVMGSGYRQANSPVPPWLTHGKGKRKKK